MIENFTMADDAGHGGKGPDLFVVKQLKLLQKEQKRFLRGVLSTSDSIR